MADVPSRVTPQRIAAMTAGGWWKNETLEAYLDRWATERPTKPAIVDAMGRLTWQELARAAERVAHGLAAAGIGPGDVVSCQLPNCNEWIILALATIELGAVLNPIPPTYRANELRFILNALEARALVVPARFRNHDHAAMAVELRADTPSLRDVFVVRGSPGEGMRSFAWLTDTAWERREGRRPLAGTDPNAVSEVVFTSGTTGEPKGVMHTANTALAIVYPLVERLGFSERDVALMSSTFGHQTGYLYGYCLTLLLGSTGVWLDVWNAEEAARLIEAERVTYTMGATPFLQDLTYSPAVDQRDLSSLRLFISAGAAIPRKLVQDARKRLRCAISAGWGMSENGLVTCNGLDDPDEKVFGTDGRPLPGMDVAVVGDDGEILPAAREGDLLVRGHSQFVGYWKRPEFTRDGHTPDGWFKTGDRAVLDADGYLAITGRVKDLIIRGGENIAPTHVEDVLLKHPAVREVAVCGRPDPDLGEIVAAAVVLDADSTVTVAELRSFAAEHLAYFEVPTSWWLRTEPLPANDVGKVRKRDLLPLWPEADGPIDDRRP